MSSTQTDVSEFLGADSSDDEKEIVWEILQNHVGEENAIYADDLAEKIGKHESYDSNPKTRKIIRSLRFVDRKPIGSGNSGYYILNTKEELQKYVREQNKRKQHADFRAEAMVEGYHDYHETGGEWE